MPSMAIGHEIHGELITKEKIRDFSIDLGLNKGDDVMVHAALSQLGYLVNGADDLVDGVLAVIGEAGTILAPGHSGQLTDPSQWTDPQVPKEWFPIIRREMRPFDPLRTPIRNRGIFADALFRLPGARRSCHPIASVIACGCRAEYYTATHLLHESEGSQSPCKKLVDNDGGVLLIGVGLESCTALHVAEFEADVPYLSKKPPTVVVDERGQNKFVTLKRYPSSSRRFEKLRPELLDQEILKERTIGGCKCSYIALKPAIRFVVSKLDQEPRYLIQE